MFDYASYETLEFITHPIVLSHKLTLPLVKNQNDGAISCLRLGDKMHVSVEYEKIVRRFVWMWWCVLPVRSGWTQRQNEYIKNMALDPVVLEQMMDNQLNYFINFICCLTFDGEYGNRCLIGHKITVDTYGGYVRHNRGKNLQNRLLPENQNANPSLQYH